MSHAPPPLEVTDLEVTYSTAAGDVHAVSGVTLSVERGERIGLVGESGSGKTATALAITGLLAPSAKSSGSIRLAGQELTVLGRRDRRRVCGSRIGMIFQNPQSSLNPAMTIGRQIAEPLRLHLGLSRARARGRVLDLLGEVGLPAPTRSFDEYPHRFSGGMRQRVMIAMALSCEPALVIADEPTTALDVTIQAQILELLATRCREHDTALLVITHDLGVLAGLADRILVMYAGRILEHGPVDSIYYRAQHPYTLALLGAISRIDGALERLHAIPGDPPSGLDPPSACVFRDRCPHAIEVCRTEVPDLLAATDPGHRRACHLADRLPRPRPAAGART
ncbi:MAG TPA: ABC transporter ATP-binding protein [Solirubrobacteraceae bacterium]|jgi:oligopeptide/dipeptide ABC transporter ATP-binding protein|nr:ABC transporter ATP-binding protein [Solirubrobacteraceae bacterium]